jgi:uncharacterized protein (DUF433 family)
MRLEDYFETAAEVDGSDRIRVKGTRLAVDWILEAFFAGDSPEIIANYYHPLLRLEQVYATITYYLHKRAQMDAYLERNRQAREQVDAEQQAQGPSEAIRQLRALRDEQNREGIRPA